MSHRMRKAAGNNLIHRQQAERKIRSIQRDTAKPAEDDGMVIFFRHAGLYSRTNHVEEVLVEAEIVGKLRVECGGEPPALAGGNGGAVR